jgi:hypothetical protein
MEGMNDDQWKTMTRRLGPRFRREQQMRPDRGRVGRARRDAVGVHPRGREDRHLLARLHDERYWTDPTGLSMMIALEELAWGDAGL